MGRGTNELKEMIGIGIDVILSGVVGVVLMGAVEVDVSLTVAFAMAL